MQYFDFVTHRYQFFLISAVLLVPGILSLLFPGGLRPGIDFTSGSIMTFRFEQSVDEGTLRQAYADLGHADAIIQRSDDGSYIVRTRSLEGDSTAALGQTESGRQRIQDALTQRFGAMTVSSYDQVSPIVAAEIVRNAMIAVIGACVGILLYLWWAFRHIKESWRYGACAVFALVHDALLVLGVFSILGRFFAFELDALFITAILTVIGFSVHDTIVVFDRIRENLVHFAGEPFESVVNHSLMQTMGRSVATSITVLLTLLTLWLFGGVTIRHFVLALLIGIASGTYSSIFNASMLLAIWENGELGRLFGRGRAQPALRRT